MQTITLQDIQATGTAVAKADNQTIDATAYAAVPSGALFARQGDVYLTKLNAVPAEADQVTPYRQLVPGETLGSRHCLDHVDGIAMYLLRRPSVLDGPIIVSYRDVTITHPVHGDLVGIPAGSVFQVTYQRQFADELRRVAD